MEQSVTALKFLSLILQSLCYAISVFTITTFYSPNMVTQANHMHPLQFCCMSLHKHGIWLRFPSNLSFMIGQSKINLLLFYIFIL